MIENNDLEIIDRMRGEVISRAKVTGENLFLVWGYPTAIVLLIEFAAMMIWNEDWCQWLWMGIPLIGAPLMVHYLRKDYNRVGCRSHSQDAILKIWIFVGFACCIGGFMMGVAGVFEQLFCSMLSLLCGFCCFITGIILHFKPKTSCGIVASMLSPLPLFFQGNQWPWQLLIASVIVVVALIIPGHLFNKYVRQVDELTS